MAEEKNYTRHANELVEIAKRRRVGRRAPGYEDNKCLVDLEAITSLIGAGGSIFHLNFRDGEDYLHQVIYGDHWFTSSSKKPFAPEIREKYIGVDTRSPEEVALEVGGE